MFNSFLNSLKDIFSQFWDWLFSVRFGSYPLGSIFLGFLFFDFLVYELNLATKSDHGSTGFSFFRKKDN